jgi:hypothetical protein
VGGTWVTVGVEVGVADGVASVVDVGVGVMVGVCGVSVGEADAAVDVAEAGAGVFVRANVAPGVGDGTSGGTVVNVDEGAGVGVGASAGAVPVSGTGEGICVGTGVGEGPGVHVPVGRALARNVARLRIAISESCLSGVAGDEPQAARVAQAIKHRTTRRTLLTIRSLYSLPRERNTNFRGVPR